MPSSRRERSQSASSSKSGHSRAERASGSMGKDGGEAGRRAAEEEEYIRRELADQTNFCNAFWGLNDAGYDVIQSRMKSSSKTLDEFRFLLKERSDIELEYSKKLSKLAKISLGKEEIGSMKNALDTIRNELEVSAKSHAELAGVMKGGLENSVAEFQNRVNNGRKQAIASITSLHKQKQTQEAYVAKARDKYEQDCIKINGYTAQSSLVQGRDLDKVTGKLDKAQSTVASNEKDYQNFTRALKDTSAKWVNEWKAYLDQCQDVEEDRLDFIKTKSWDYANAVSAVCVADDESSERVRVALENCETSRDIDMFIQYAGTGPAIPDPPEYINYAKGQPPPARPSFRTANFQRNSNRPRQPPPSAGPLPGQGGMQNGSQAPIFTAPAPQQQQVRTDDRARQNSSGGSQSGSQAPRPRPPSGEQEISSGAFKPPPGAVGLHGMTASPSNMSPNKTERALPRQSEPGVEASALPPSMSHPQGQPSSTPERRMSARNFISRTPSMSRGGPQGHTPKSTVDLGRGRIGVADSNSTLASQAASTSSALEEMDPIAKALADLRAARPGGRSPAPQSPMGGAPTPLSKSPAPAAAPQKRQSSYRAPSPAGSHNASSRPRSPSAAFMAPPPRAASPLPVEEVVGSYGQSFPGERRDISRQNSSSSRVSANHQASASSMTVSQHQPERSRSPAPQGGSFAGVGAGNRSPSPQPFAQQQRGPQQQHRAQQASQASNLPPRSTTPLGISLDARGSVTHDLMADEFVKRTGSVSPAIPPQQQQRGPTHQQYQQPLNPSSPQRPQAQYAPAPTPSQSQPSHLHQPSSQHQQYSSHQPSVSSPYGAPLQQVPSHQSQPSMASQYSSPHIAPQHIQSPYGAPVQPVQPVQPPSQSPAPYVQNGHQHSASVYSQRPAASPSPAPVGAYQGYSHPPPQQQAPISNHYVQSSSYSQVPNQQQQQQQYGQVPAPTQAPVAGETAASAYMQQYRTQNSTPAPAPASAPAQTAMQQQRQPSYNAAQPAQAYGQQQQQQQWQQQQPQQQQQQQPAPTHNPPPPNQVVASQQVQQQPPAQSNGQPHPPTGQFSDSGKPILFYVKALYDYSATMDEEFSFTAGDIIAVTHTEADGWWQGELLDEARRRPGSNTFPSNFVVLLM